MIYTRTSRISASTHRNVKLGRLYIWRGSESRYVRTVTRIHIPGHFTHGHIYHSLITEHKRIDIPNCVVYPGSTLHELGVRHGDRIQVPKDTMEQAARCRGLRTL